MAALKKTIRRCRLAGGASQASQLCPWLGRFLFGYLLLDQAMLGAAWPSAVAVRFSGTSSRAGRIMA